MNLFIFFVIDIEEEDNAGLTAFHEAASLDVVKYLHEKGAKNVSKALFYPAIYGQLDTLKYLMDNQADINTTFIEGETVLIGSITSAKLDIVVYVIEQGADVNAKNDNGLTALHQAAFYGSLDIVKFLIERNAKIDAKDNQERTPLHLACMTSG
jgi:ankyrin repeat protein